MTIKRILALTLLATALCAGGASAQTLRIGLAEDPDVLDPTLARTFVGRIVFAAMCDKLVDISPELEIVPQLATAWQWTDGNRGLIMKLRQGVKFQDGETVRRRRGQVQHRAPPDHAGLEPQGRDQRGRARSRSSTTTPSSSC